MRLSLLWVCALVAACGSVNKNTGGDGGGDDTDGGVVDNDDGVKSGTRLKVQWYDFGGTRQPLQIYDKMRTENCNYSNWSDGNRYCTPDGGQVFYSNGTCTQKVGANPHPDQTSSCSNPVPNYFIERDYTACNSTVAHVYQKGASITEPGGVFYQKNSDGTCGGPYDATGYDFYAVNVEVKSQMLVQLTSMPGTGSGRFVQGYVTSQDGFQAPDVVQDTTLQTGCYFSANTGATMGSCVPNNSYYTSTYHDATCTTPEVETSPGCTLPEYAVTYSNNNCPYSIPTYFKVGMAVDSTPLYYKQSDNSCVSTGGNTTDSFYTTTGVVTLPNVQRLHDTIAGREIVPVHYHNQDQTFRDYTLYDTKHQAECYTRTFADGSVRCLGNYGIIGSYFTDAACSSPIDIMSLYTGPATCAAQPLPSFAVRQIPPTGNQCFYDYEIHSVGTVYTPQLYQFSGSCFAVNDSNTTHYTVGAIIPQSDFLAATVVQDQ